jgi:multiple sugar transport system ATP-binding protein
MDVKAQSGPSALPVEVTLIDPMGADSLLWGTVGGETVSVRIGPDDTFRPGEKLDAWFQPDHASLFDAESGQRI